MLPLLLAAALAAVPSSPSPRSISMTGEARVAFRPNQVLATFLLATPHRDQAVAKRLGEEKVGKLVVACKAAGVEPRSLTLNDNGVVPEYRGSEVIGYVSNRTIVLTLTDMARVDEALAAALRSGAVQTGPVVLMNTEHQGFETKARIAAATAARERAKGVTEALGAKLGLPVIVSDRTPSVESIQAGTFTLLPDGSVSSSFASREMVVNSQVTVQFDMEPAT